MQKNAPAAIWSLVLGILSVVFCCLPLGIPAIICGHVARAKIRESQGALAGDGMALAGLVTGYLSIVGTILALIVAAMVGVIAAIAAPEVSKHRDGIGKNDSIRQTTHSQDSLLIGTNAGQPAVPKEKAAGWN